MGAPLPLAGVLPKTRSGYVVYRGPSAINGKPIVGVLTHVNADPDNIKIGAMWQLWIVPDPVGAPWAPDGDGGTIGMVSRMWHAGIDESVCGKCTHRGQRDADGEWGGRSCYVEPQPIVSILRALLRGSYPDASGPLAVLAVWHAVRRHRHRGVEARAGRWGAYGDPLAIPREALEPLLRVLLEAGIKWTGYTHRFKRRDAQWARKFLMASTDDRTTDDRARTLGWRRFQVVYDGQEPADDAVQCLVYAERADSCATCGLCDGTRGGERKAVASVWVPVHGIQGHAMAGNVERN